MSSLDIDLFISGFWLLFFAKFYSTSVCLTRQTKSAFWASRKFSSNSITFSIQETLLQWDHYAQFVNRLALTQNIFIFNNRIIDDDKNSYRLYIK